MFVALSFVVALVAPSQAADTRALARVAAQQMQAFSSGSRDAMVATFVARPAIYDDVSPFIWRSAAAWYDAIHPFFRAVSMQPGSATDVSIDHDRAYATFPFMFSALTLKGHRVHAAGYWTGIFVRQHGVWRIDDLTLSISS